MATPDHKSLLGKVGELEVLVVVVDRDDPDQWAGHVWIVSGELVLKLSEGAAGELAGLLERLHVDSELVELETDYFDALADGEYIEVGVKAAVTRTTMLIDREDLERLGQLLRDGEGHINTIKSADFVHKPESW